MSWTNSFYCSEYELAIFRKGVESGRKALRNKIQSLQAELEAVKGEKRKLVNGVIQIHSSLSIQGMQKPLLDKIEELLKGKENT